MFHCVFCLNSLKTIIITVYGLTLSYMTESVKLFIKLNFYFFDAVFSEYQVEKIRLQIRHQRG